MAQTDIQLGNKHRDAQNDTLKGTNSNYSVYHTKKNEEITVR